MDPFTQFLLTLAQQLGISPVAAAMWVPLIVIFSNRLAKVIPDNATGVLKYVRMVMSVIGIKIDNNTGVAPIKDSEGKIIERSEPDAKQVVADGVLELGDSNTGSESVQGVFKLGAAALESKGTDHAQG